MCIVIGLIIVSCLSQTEAPRPQSYTELYFTNRPQQSNAVRVGTKQKIPFTIHNHEHRTTTYRYKLMAVSLTSSTEGQLGEGTVTLAHDHAQTISPIATLPLVGNHTTLKVVLNYAGVSPGDSKLSPQTEAIHYWVDVTPKPASKGSNHASS